MITTLKSASHGPRRGSENRLEGGEVIGSETVVRWGRGGKESDDRRRFCYP